MILCKHADVLLHLARGTLNDVLFVVDLLARGVASEIESVRVVASSSPREESKEAAADGHRQSRAGASAAAGGGAAAETAAAPSELFHIVHSLARFDRYCAKVRRETCMYSAVGIEVPL